jgi:NAD(P)-dependent dehydrogenase (short-subunit alcohol dehydrogenase family)
MLDVSDSAAMQEVAQDWIGHAGLPDLVIANAGVAGGFDTAQASDLPVLRRMLEINVLGPATTFQPFLQALRQQPRAACSLVSIASIAGWRGMPGNGAYCASKARFSSLSAKPARRAAGQQGPRAHRLPRLSAHRHHRRQ